MRAFAFASLLSPLLFSLAVTPLVHGGEESDEVTKDQLRNVLRVLNAPEAERRAVAYKACRDRGEEFKETYAELLGHAWDHHAHGITQVIEARFGPRAGTVQLSENYQQWKKAAEDARKHIQTNHNKAKRKLEEMDALFATAERAWRTIAREETNLQRSDPIAARLEDAAKALGEIKRELAWSTGEADKPSDKLDLGEILETVVGKEDPGAAKRAREYLETRAALAGMFEALAEAHSENEQARWAAADLRTFARLLNERRAVVGLHPLTLNENLSNACVKHSEEMARLGYFSHDSPVEKNRTPPLRAKNAGFNNFAGECIFMGNRDPAAAEQAWWYSCGHRLINYNSGPQILGIGRHDAYWTLNTGRK